MRPAADIETALRNWARATPGIGSVVLFGSQARGVGDADSDWDLHVIARHPRIVADRAWLRRLELGEPAVYAPRDPVIGSVGRATAIWPGLEMDFLVLSTGLMTLARLVVSTGLHRRVPRFRRRLSDMALVLRPGYRFLHGERSWGGLYRRVSSELPEEPLGERELRRRAELFVADYVWIERKLSRGEFLAAQRVLHRSLAELNFDLAAEIARRSGRPAWHEARRIETWASPEDCEALRVSTGPTGPELRAALDKAASTFRRQMGRLLPGGWRWPLDERR